MKSLLCMTPKERERLHIKLLVDKEKDRVVFAESDKDFVDTLLSFLTLPAGTIVRLLGKQSSLGCMDRLYESVEKLDVEFLQTKACRSMLLSPVNASHRRCQDLQLHVDDKLRHIKAYVCGGSLACVAVTCGLFSVVPGTLCACGKTMTHQFLLRYNDSTHNLGVDGVFVKGGVRYMVTDDLCVMKSSTEATRAVLKRFGIQDGTTTLEERVVELRRTKILELLKRSIKSSTPLSDLFLKEKWTSSKDNIQRAVFAQAKIPSRNPTTTASKKITVRVIRDGCKGDVIYAEAGEDFVDLVFSFLTFPLGSLIKLLDGSSCIGSIDNLYQSVQILSDYSDCIRSNSCKLALIAPKVPSHFNCDDQLLKQEEDVWCESCGVPLHKSGDKQITILAANPKSSIPSSKSGGGYVKGGISKFLITDDMYVSPFNSIDAIRKAKAASFHHLKEENITLGEVEALKLLKACLISDSTLTDAFS